MCPAPIDSPNQNLYHRLPQLTKYDESSKPEEHIRAFATAVEPYNKYPDVLAKLFVPTFTVRSNFRVNAPTF